MFYCDRHQFLFINHKIIKPSGIGLGKQGYKNNSPNAAVFKLSFI